MFCIENRRMFDSILAVAHTAQAITYTVFAALPEFHPGHIPVTLVIPNNRPGLNTTAYEPETLFYANIVSMVAVFFYVTGLFHLVRAYMSSPIESFERLVKLRYKEKIEPKPGDNKSPKGEEETIQQVAKRRLYDRSLRWYEYSISSTIMIYIICLVSGISDIYTLAGLGGCNMAMILFGKSGDLIEQKTENMIKTFLYGSIIGIVPWVCILAQVIIIGVRIGAENIPFILAISITLFLLFFSFSIAELSYIWTFKNTDKINDKKTANGPPSIGMDSQKTRKAIDQELSRERSECGYQILSAVSKTLLGGLVAGAMLTL